MEDGRKRADVFSPGPAPDAKKKSRGSFLKYKKVGFSLMKTSGEEF